MLPTLTTERLVLRPFALADAPEVQRLAGAREIADTTLTIPHPYKDGMAEAWIATHADTFVQNRGVTLAIEHVGALVGAISLVTTQRTSHQAELGYWIAHASWGKGFATEASRALVPYAFDVMKLARVHSCHLSRNPASGKVMQKLGMQHEGTRRGHVRKWNKLEDLELYGILRG